MFDLKGKVALITGGSRGIGRAIAIRLAENGVNLVVNYVRHKRDAQDTANAVEKLGGRCLLVKANVAQGDDVERMFSEIRDEFGVLDILVSNAASGVLKDERAAQAPRAQDHLAVAAQGGDGPGVVLELDADGPPVLEDDAANEACDSGLEVGATPCGS